jgi:DMSO/TMAO reductase YedYZ molybdopterin-dependent catalytic subunit
MILYYWMPGVTAARPQCHSSMSDNWVPTEAHMSTPANTSPPDQAKMAFTAPQSMSPRVTDWSLALAGAVAIASGVISLDSGHPDAWLVFALHGAAGLWLLLLLWGKLRRVWPRVVHPRVWDRRTVFGLLAIVVVALVIGSGIWWVAGGDIALAGFNLMNWHIILGFGLAAVLGIHMLARARPLRVRDLRGRRQVLHYGALLLGAAALWPAQQAAQRALALPGASRRFTGSREAGSFRGNAFPWTSWVADQPRPLDPDTWRLTVGGEVATPLALAYADVVAPGDVLEATLDCTSGFYSTQQWRGVCIGRLLERAQPLPDARWVRFISVTGYRWSLPMDEAANALLATHVGDEALIHEHGAPLRLVAPGRRAFQWVKWIVRVEALTQLDYGEIVSIHTSWLSPAGRGQP